MYANASRSWLDQKGKRNRENTHIHAGQKRENKYTHDKKREHTHTHAYAHTHTHTRVHASIHHLTQHLTCSSDS